MRKQIEKDTYLDQAVIDNLKAKTVQTYKKVISKIKLWDQNFFEQHDSEIFNFFDYLCALDSGYKNKLGFRQYGSRENEKKMLTWENEQPVGYNGIVKRPDGVEGFYIKSSTTASNWFNLPPMYAKNKRLRQQFEHICIAKTIVGLFIAQMDPTPFLNEIGLEKFQEHKQWVNSI